MEIPGVQRDWYITGTLYSSEWHVDPELVKHVKIPEGTTVIGELAFWGFYNLESVEIPRGVERIEKKAFADCTSLKTITLLEGLKVIERDAFEECSKLESVDVKEVEHIGYGAFARCSSLKSISLPESSQIMEAAAFVACSSLESIKIPYGVETIEKETFELCTSLRTVEIPTTVQTIEKYAFLSCTSLRTVEIPTTVQTIEKYAFAHCSSLASVILRKYTTVEEDAFPEHTRVTFRRLTYSEMWGSDSTLSLGEVVDTDEMSTDKSAGPGRKREAVSSGNYYDWTMPIGGKPLLRMPAPSLDDLTLNGSTLLYRGQGPSLTKEIGSGSYGTVSRLTFQYPGDSTTVGFSVDIAAKVLKINDWDWDEQTDSIDGMRSAKKLADCDLVRFKAWVTHLNVPSSKKRALEGEPSLEDVLEAQSTIDIVGAITPESRMIVAMQPMHGDGKAFLQSKFYQEDPGLSAAGDSRFILGLDAFAKFLVSLKRCLKWNNATFADMKLANVGYHAEKTTFFSPNIQWRLLDLDGVNIKVATYTYTDVWGELELSKQTDYAIGVTIAMYMSPKLGISMGRYFGTRNFDAERCAGTLKNVYTAVEKIAAEGESHGRNRFYWIDPLELIRSAHNILAENYSYINKI